MRLFCRLCTFGKTFSAFKYYHTSSVLNKIVQFNLSDIGEGIREVTVRDWFVKVGDKVSQFDNVCLVESDKASVSITSRFDGTVKKLYYEIDDVALVGKPLIDIDINDESTSSDDIPENTAVKDLPKPENISPQANKEKEIVQNAVHEQNIPISKQYVKPSSKEVPVDIDNFLEKSLATPAVRRIAKEHNVELSSVKASGKGGRVLKEDIFRHLDDLTPLNVEHQNDFSDKTVQITGIKKAMVKTMTKSNSIPTFGYCDEVDLTTLMELRKDVKAYAAKKGINITFMPFFIKALSKALNEYPELNSSVDESCEYITYKTQHNIGIAMDTEKGLIVPNIKNVQSLNVLEVGVKLNRLLELGRTFKLGPSDMSGGTITISNIGIIGGTYLRPLILPPEVCILALGKTNLVPKFNEKDEITKRYVLNASWAADHRVIDGATLAKFSNTWKEYIENPNFLLMDL